MLTDEGLPLASGASVPRDLVVREEAELAQERGLNLADVRAIAREESANEERLDEELRVERTRGGVERGALNIAASITRTPLYSILDLRGWTRRHGLERRRCAMRADRRPPRS